MSKYAIKKEFLFFEMFTFPIIEPVLPLAEKALGSLVSLPRTDRNVNVKKLRIPVKDAYINALLYVPKELSDKKKRAFARLLSWRRFYLQIGAPSFQTDETVRSLHSLQGSACRLQNSAGA